ncbi:SCO family protein [Sphingobacterium zeae]|uniref:Protein SCO1/2 n=1 Tax=Sphingobacterium zeae TaxID=1776859 RepID=A0ABU0U738_9SPHI|nr:SCO family protein [Sphingobacterium zeae]MDQ1150782.1 protein SCO1/2 [Sphingobacterium zeae]
MKSKTRVYSWFVALVLAVPLLAFMLVRYVASNDIALPYYGENFLEIKKGEAKHIGAFEFSNQEGKLISSEFVKGKVWIACYFFTSCPTICPKMIAGMGDIQEEFSDEHQLRMVSFTVDPDRDTPAVLKEYANIRNINTVQWNLVTGRKKDLYRYARKDLKIMATDGDGGPQDFIHSDRIVLIDQSGYARGYYDGTEAADIKQLIKDIKKLLK